VVVGVQVRHVDGLQVSQDVSGAAAAKLTVQLKQCALAAVEQNEVVCDQCYKSSEIL
jgi:hypothetical protein